MAERSLEQLLGAKLSPRRRRPPPIQWVTWVAHMDDGNNLRDLDDIKHARRVAADGWTLDGEAVALITRDSGESMQQEFYPGDTI